ncbi:hypothetical protein ACH4E8_22910 [Streptomyces sp. NPDC017979]|uniref:hypothetical protein n=1 Tax=Streptomyces sp. NPDC017979 TaxID=3365024 RepID=UPI00379F421E
MVSSSPPSNTSPAEPTRATDGRSAPKSAAEGVVSASRPDPHPTSDGRTIVGGLHIVAPGRGTTPTARSWCACGRDLYAVGHRRTLDLIADHAHHRDVCPHHNQEGRAAA